MFGFLFKRADRSAAAAQSEAAQKARQQIAQRVASVQVTDTARQQAMARADALTEEGAAVSFILQADFADARLRAAQLVQSAEGLEQVLKAMRNVDRRVAKLMQSKLDVLRVQQQTAAQATLCLQQAQRLLNEAQLLPNQVADLDRAWKLIAMPVETQQQEFQQLSAALAGRLATQAALQRSVLGLLAHLRQLNTQIINDPQALSADAIAAQTAQISAEMQQHENSVEAISLPKNLATEFVAALKVVHQRLDVLQQHQQALFARQALLTEWEATPVETLSPAVLRRSWSALAALPVELSDETLEQRYASLLQQSIAAVKPKISQQPASAEQAPSTDKIATQKQFLAALDGLEAALEEGALQAGMDHDKALRAMDFKALKLSSSENTRLTQARSELGRLQGWARWGGNVSREELMKAAQELPGQELVVTELAKKIGSLRARWKSLDSSAGSAPKVLWDGFDAACTTAYIPVAAHFQQLADERQRNQIKALLLIEEIQQYAAVALGDTAGPDWKAIAQFCQQKQQAWRTMGTINRSDKKLLDKSFANATQQLLAPLMLQQQREITQREKLITEAAELPVNQRDTTDRLRELQQRWQEHAKALPLSRQDEQQLWQRFRSACDTIFAQRKEAASTADTERRQNLQLKEALCASLETATTQAKETLPALLRQAQQDWNKSGAVPRAVEAQVEARYNAAVESLQARVEQARQDAVLIEAHALCDKLALCQLVEVSLGLESDVIASDADAVVDDADTDGNPATWNANWQALPALPNAFEKAMRNRFDTALDLHNVGDRLAMTAYLATLENSRETLLQELLRAEIIAGVDSPTSLTRERLQVQVEVLQAALKAGSAEVSSSAQLLRVCGLPALMDYETRGRAEQLILSVKGRPNL
ncbi:DUF349 domain-containing protein [Glaciimonas sp. PCH181]|uniref:DUF349 domain-containing protein n=1 Tax=Glaciimonas sp. PCH181 TaxID=2133943 RepID=UPI000D38F11C|nr:DUF349 domain-containing protein [Glaciimonas sp. PCH181]PUA16551.1 DUF349 domain-containing protein [Glaciimonas sp. PCH181]